MSLISKLESILFVASKPLSVKKLGNAVNENIKSIKIALEDLRSKYNNKDSGIRILENGDEWQTVSSPDNREAAESFLKAEVSGELTRPQLETLTVVSYCGPVTKPELEQIRGVNCSLILRNLMMRGLIKESENEINLLPRYEVTMDYLRHLGLGSVQELPNYGELHRHPFVERALEENGGEI